MGARDRNKELGSTNCQQEFMRCLEKEERGKLAQYRKIVYQSKSTERLEPP